MRGVNHLKIMMYKHAGVRGDSLRFKWKLSVQTPFWYLIFMSHEELRSIPWDCKFKENGIQV